MYNRQLHQIDKSSWFAYDCGVETFAAATSPSGKARVCKTLIAGSIPAVASEIEAIYQEIPVDRFLCFRDLDASAVRVRNTFAAGKNCIALLLIF